MNIWTQQLASRYGVNLTAASAGGSGYAQINSRISLKPDAAGVSTTPTMTEQIGTFLASGAPRSTDLFLIGGGTSDILAGFAAYRANPTTAGAAQFTAAATQAGTELGNQVQRLVNAGARYVLVTNLYDVSRSPLGTSSGQAAALTAATRGFNDALKLSIQNLGSNVLLVDAENYFNLVISFPTSYSFTNGTTVVCTSVDPGNGIGAGTGQINSGLCNSGTIASGLDPALYEFADNVYFTPQAQRLFGNFAYDRLRLRF